MHEYELYIHRPHAYSPGEVRGQLVRIKDNMTMMHTSLDYVLNACAIHGYAVRINMPNLIGSTTGWLAHWYRDGVNEANKATDAPR